MNHIINYIIITPVKNEGKFIAKTIESVLSQTIPPSSWIIVDDGSTDDTCAVVEGYLARADFIRLLKRHSSPTRDVGYGGIRAFSYAARDIDPLKYDFVVNLDADVAFEPDYFERLFKKFAENEGLGIAGGLGWSYHVGRLTAEKIPRNHVPGYTKVYRRECYLDIQPVREIPSWDTIDELEAQRAGWETANFDDIQIIHLKPMTLGAGNILKGKYVQGKVSYLIGYPFDFMVIRSIKLMAEFPFLIGGILAFTGYLSGLFSRERIVLEEDLVNYLRKKQRARIYNKLPGIFNKSGN
ncbi:MAG: glycosyltransferase family 2 protein [Candidatus Aquicultor sp.]